MQVSGQLHAPAALTQREETLDNCCIGSWVGSGFSLDEVAKIKIPTPAGNQILIMHISTVISLYDCITLRNPHTHVCSEIKGKNV
jgi:hypothetical protein